MTALHTCEDHTHDDSGIPPMLFDHRGRIITEHHKANLDGAHPYFPNHPLFKAPEGQDAHVLQGPYGTLSRQAVQQGHVDGYRLTDPRLSRLLQSDAGQLEALCSGVARDLHQVIAQEYLKAGASIIAVPTFALRHGIGAEGINIGKGFEYGASSARRAIESQGNGKQPVLVASLGPHGDCYDPKQALEGAQAVSFHREQLRQMKLAQVETAWFETFPASKEAQGAALAARIEKSPCVVSFTINRNGRLKSGETLAEAVQKVDEASGGWPLGYSVNCCDIGGIEPALQEMGPAVSRILGVYPNAAGDPESLNDTADIIGVQNSVQMAIYLTYLTHKYGLKFIGGCCGVDVKDVATIAQVAKTHKSLLSAGNGFQVPMGSGLPKAKIPYEAAYASI